MVARHGSGCYSWVARVGDARAAVGMAAGRGGRAHGGAATADDAEARGSVEAGAPRPRRGGRACPRGCRGRGLRRRGAGAPRRRPRRSAPPTQLTFGVFGPEDELTALGNVTGQFNALYEPAKVKMETWPDEDALIDALKSGERRPRRVHGLPRRPRVAARRELTQPVDELLDERGVDFGDDYSRDALQAFSADDRLQCMPYGVSPMVIYYNKDLVDFDRMASARARRPRRRAARLDLRPVRRRGRLRHPPAPGHQGRAHRADARGAGPVHLLRRRPGVRRRDGPHVARVLRQHHPGRARAAPSSCCATRS